MPASNSLAQADPGAPEAIEPKALRRQKLEQEECRVRTPKGNVYRVSVRHARTPDQYYAALREDAPLIGSYPTTMGELKRYLLTH